MSRFRAVLFDWKGTLFYDEPDLDWLRNSAASLGWRIEADEVDQMVAAVDRATADPRVVAARSHSDCSLEANRAAGKLLLETIAGLPPELATAIWQRDGDLSATLPYSDTASVLHALAERALRVAIVSDIHYDVRPHFAQHGLDGCVDAYVLSYQHGVQKPDTRLFQLALDALGVSAADALMVGDRAPRDAGGLPLGITTLLLPRARVGAPRGLDAVLALVDGT